VCLGARYAVEDDQRQLNKPARNSRPDMPLAAVHHHSNSGSPHISGHLVLYAVVALSFTAPPWSHLGLLSHQSSTRIDSALQNEEAHLRQAFASTRVNGAQKQPQVIVVDGGSWDGTLKQAQACNGVLLLRTPIGARGRQLNSGMPFCGKVQSLQAWSVEDKLLSLLSTTYSSLIAQRTMPRLLGVLVTGVRWAGQSLSIQCSWPSGLEVGGSTQIRSVRLSAISHCHMSDTAPI
jgi:hypothetical protein